MADHRLLLNLGCGSRTDPRWVNIDYSRAATLKRWPILRRWASSSLPPNYRNWDLRKGIPAADRSAEAAYSSHLLEHLAPEVGLAFCREQWRVLRPGGIIRVVVPDLELLATEYLQSLAAVRAGGKKAELRHEWAVIRLLDQLVRTEPGGRMASWLRAHSDESWVRELGGIFAEIGSPGAPGQDRSWVRRFRAWILAENDPVRSGEMHRWMYDECSLRRLLTEAGFKEITAVDPDTSRIADWRKFFLDRNEQGEVHQPGSLYMEAIR